MGITSRRWWGFEDLESPDDDTLLAYTEQFIGLGDPFAPFWFVWSGPRFPSLPGGTDLARDDEEATEWHRFERFRLLSAIKRWSEHPRAVRRFEDLYDEHTGSRYPYRATVAGIAEACRGGPAPLNESDAIEPDVFRAELFPLSAHALQELGTSAILAPFMHSRRAYVAYRKIQRLHALRAAIAQFNPTLVFMFGRCAENVWFEMPDPTADVEWEQRDGVDWAVATSRLYVSAPAPNPFFMNARQREELGYTVAALLRPPRAKSRRRT